MYKENEKHKIFIYGVPGSGKTSFSRELQKQLGCPTVEADGLRHAAQKQYSREEWPFLYLPTTDAFVQFGKFNKSNVIKGFLAVREALALYVEKEIDKYPDGLIMEAAFLDPIKLGKFGELTLIITSDEQLHSGHFYEHRKRDTDAAQKFHAARIIQDYLIKESENNKVRVVDNKLEMKDLIDQYNNL